MKYRPDVEGLRALAVGMVVAAHAGLPGFSGGFIGVDVFFVISGYLVTGLLFEQWKETGRIALGDFYVRRFRRLLPALLVMLLGTSLICWWALPPFAQMSEAIAGAAAALWVANIHFAHAGVDYFGAGAEPSVFLHTWSLGVEEQFYLAWPVVLILMLWKADAPCQAEKRLQRGLGILAIAGLTGAVLATAGDARLTFYMMPTRAWQFALGGLAYTMGRGDHAADGAFGVSRQWAPPAGGLLLLVSVVLIDESRAYPGWWAALPTVATALVLWGGQQAQQQHAWTQRLLRHRCMQAIGRVSYGWYLWHWPLLMLTPLVLPVHGAAGRVWAVGASLALAVLSYHLIERPVRQWNALLRWPRLTFVVAVLLMGLAALSMFCWGEHASELSARSESPYHVKFPELYAHDCDDWYHSDTLKPCIFGSPAAKHTAYLMGDSIGVQWFPAVQKIFAAPDWRLVVLTKSSCPMVARSFHYSRLGREFRECDVWRQRALELIARDKPHVVFIGSSHNAPLDQNSWIDGTAEVLDQLTAVSDRVVVLHSTPTLPFNGAYCAGGKSQSMRQFEEARDCTWSGLEPRRTAVTAWISRATENRPKVRVLDMSDAVCPQGVCRAVMNGQLVFRDQQHLDARFVESLTDTLRSSLGSGLEFERR